MNMKRGFTLVELMVVVGIIGILAAVLVASFSGSTDSARAAQCKSNMRNLAAAYLAVKMMPTNNDNAWYSASADLDTGEEHNCPIASFAGWQPHNCAWPWIDHEAVGNTYEPSQEKRDKMLMDHAWVWKTINGSRTSYVCPTHQQYAKKMGLGDPLWSYVLNGWFGCRSHPTTIGQRKFGYYDANRNNRYRADRLLLFAEMAAVPMSVNGQEIQDGNLSGAALDSALDYDSGEVIGFNHRNGKNVVGNVAFFDGHVEQFQAPKEKSNIKELTEWLCDYDEYYDYDIGYRNGAYEKVQ